MECRIKFYKGKFEVEFEVVRKFFLTAFFFFIMIEIFQGEDSPIL